jgi:hypothetical protein
MGELPRMQEVSGLRSAARRGCGWRRAALRQSALMQGQREFMAPSCLCLGLLREAQRNGAPDLTRAETNGNPWCGHRRREAPPGLWLIPSDERAIRTNR